ncbi:MAG: hypothetical protein NTU44_08005 [Bacteroidetes bacterium]|nr:hypothetical protein [Bacteroidota bacterium]
MTLEALALQGREQVFSSMAAGIGNRVIDIRKESIKESMSDFTNIEHRIEFVANIHGIEFINDSRATNIHSTWFTMESMSKPLIWIAGAMENENDYSPLLELVRKKVKAIIYLGGRNENFINAFIGIQPNICETVSMDEAVMASYRIGKKGDLVLLSPACPSFNLFKNYEERGEMFKKSVKKL